MIIPCLTLTAGKVVNQNTADPTWFEKFHVCPEISIVCSDYEEKTRKLVKDFLKKSLCVVQFTANDLEQVLDILDNGARFVVQKKDSPILADLPKERVAVSFECAVDKTNVTDLATEISNQKDRASRFIVTFHGNPGKEFSLAEYLKKLVDLVGKDVKLVASGDIVSSYAMISDLHFVGVDVHVSSALLSSTLDLGEAIVACLKSDRPDGLFSTIVVSSHDYIGTSHASFRNHSHG